MMADYARIAYQSSAHRARYRRHVQAMPRKLICQECAGAGGWINYISWEIGGPREECGWCEGTGFVTRWLRGKWLRSRPRRPKHVAQELRASPCVLEIRA